MLRHGGRGGSEKEGRSVLAVQGGGAGNAMGFVVVLVFLCKRIRDRTKTEEERGGKKRRGFTIDNRLLYNTQYHPVWGGGGHR